MIILLPLYLLAAFATIVWVIRRRRFDVLSNLGFIAVLGNAAIFSFYGSGIVLYREPLSWPAAAYLAGSIALFVVGTWVGGKLPIANVQSRALSKGTFQTLILGGSALGIVGLAAYVANYFASGLSTMDAHTARNLLQSGQVPGHPLLVKLGFYFGPCGLIAALLMVMARRRLATPLKLLVYLGFLSGPAFTITMVGRMSIIPVTAAVGLLGILVLATGGRVHFERWERAGLKLGAVILAAYMLLLPLFRIGETDQISHTVEVVNADPSPALIWVEDHLPTAVASIFVQIVVYGSHQPVMFSRFWEGMSVGPYWGAYQFSVTMARFFSMDVKFGEIRDEIHAQSSVYDLFGNVWATAVRDAVIDFGRIGALVQMLVFGVAGGYFRKQYLTRQTLGAGLLYGFFAGWITFSFSVSATTLSYYEMFMLGSLILYVLGLRNMVVEPDNLPARARPSPRPSSQSLADHPTVGRWA